LAGPFQVTSVFEFCQGILPTKVSSFFCDLLMVYESMVVF
jgi:hypothetical protein